MKLSYPNDSKGSDETNKYIDPNDILLEFDIKTKFEARSTSLISFPVSFDFLYHLLFITTMFNVT